jgi:hypothetical protein
MQVEDGFVSALPELNKPRAMKTQQRQQLNLESFTLLLFLPRDK